MFPLKFIVLFIFFIFAFGSRSSAVAQDIKTETRVFSNPDELALAIFVSVKSDDFTEFAKYLAKKDDMKQILIKKDFSEERRKEVMSMLDDYEYTLKVDAKKEFENIIKKGLESGVNWDESVFVASEYGITTESGFMYADLDIFFKSGENKYKIVTIGCMKISKGWKMFDKLKWGGKQ